MERTLQQIQSQFYTSEIIDYLSKSQYKSIALQFPDSLLQYSTDVYMHLSEELPDKLFYVLGDTSYGECCLDDVNASHSATNDMIIHFGKCCLSTSSKRQPNKEILYVLPTADIGSHAEPLQIRDLLVQQFSGEASNTQINLFLDLEFYSSLVGDLVSQDFGPLNVTVGVIDTEKFSVIPNLNLEQPFGESSINILGRHFKTDNQAKNKVMVYIGRNESSEYSTDSTLCEILHYNIGSDFTLAKLDPTNLEFQTIKQGALNKKLLQRYSLIEKVKEAEVIGILIGTVVVDNYMEIINNIRYAISKTSQKKLYEVLIGKLNEPKLKNFNFIDIYVMIGCPETSLIDPKKFNMSVVTPHELFMALEPEAFPWESKVITDFNAILPKIRQLYSKKDVEECKESFVTDEESLALVKKEHQELVPIFSSQILHRYDNLSYKGLELALDKREVQSIQKGLTGIASSYDRDADNKQVVDF